MVIAFKVFQRAIKSAIFFLFKTPGEKGVSSGLGAIERSLGLTGTAPCRASQRAVGVAATRRGSKGDRPLPRAATSCGPRCDEAELKRGSPPAAKRDELWASPRRGGAQKGTAHCRASRRWGALVVTTAL